MSAFNSKSFSSSHSYSLSAAFPPVTGRNADKRTVTPVTAAGDPVHDDPSDQLEAWEWQRSLAAIRVVSRRTGVSPEEMLGRSHCPRETAARHRAMFALRHHVGLSFAMIGRIFGRHSTTVIEAVRQLEQRSRAEAAVHAELDELQEELTS